MTMPADQPPATGEELVARLVKDIETLDRELAEIDLLVGQARGEAARHEQRRVQAAEKLADTTDAEGYVALVQLTRRAVLMEAQVDLLDGKRRALARHRDALAQVAEAIGGLDIELVAPGAASASTVAASPGGPAASGEPETLPPSLSRVVLNAQEDLRREIARAMHDGPAQSLTNIVLQAQIVDRLLDRDTALAKGELKLLAQMVQQTLDATKGFIFDVRPMVLDDLGLVPTLRRAARDRGRRAHVPVEFDSMGPDRRLPQDVESTVFRILDEALASYLALNPDRVVLRLDWGDELEAHLSAERTAVLPAAHENELPEIPTADVPDQIRRMIEERHEARSAAVAAAEEAAVVQLPSAARRDILERAGSIGATVEILSGGSELRLVVALPTLEAADGDAGDGADAPA